MRFDTLFVQSVTQPDAAARTVMALKLPTPVIWAALVLAGVMSALLGAVATQMMPEAGGLMPGMMANPVLLAVAYCVVLSAFAFGAYRVGQAFGGTGSFEDTLALVAWLQSVLVALQLVQIVLLFILPALAGLMFLTALGLFMWMWAQFIKTVHGFTSAPMVLGISFAVLFAALFVLSFLLVLLGVTPPENLQNV